MASATGIPASPIDVAAGPKAKAGPETGPASRSTPVESRIRGLSRKLPPTTDRSRDHARTQSMRHSINIRTQLTEPTTRLTRQHIRRRRRTRRPKLTKMRVPAIDSPGELIKPTPVDTTPIKPIPVLRDQTSMQVSRRPSLLTIRTLVVPVPSVQDDLRPTGRLTTTPLSTTSNSRSTHGRPWQVHTLTGTNRETLHNTPQIHTRHITFTTINTASSTTQNHRRPCVNVTGRTPTTYPNHQPHHYVRHHPPLTPPHPPMRQRFTSPTTCRSDSPACIGHTPHHTGEPSDSDSPSNTRTKRFHTARRRHVVPDFVVALHRSRHDTT